MKADIIEIFSSWQGEGIHLGVRQVFVRFNGCNINCSYCDTLPASHSKNIEKNTLLENIDDLEKRFGPHHSVAITGGEPLVHVDFLKSVLPKLKKKDFKLYLETNGTLPDALSQVINFIDIISMDIKLPSSAKINNFWREHRKFLEIAKTKDVFIKIVVTKNSTLFDLKEAMGIIKDIDRNFILVLQGASQSKKIGSDISPSPAKLIDFWDAAKRELRDVRVIPQVHKILKVR